MVVDCGLLVNVIRINIFRDIGRVAAALPMDGGELVQYLVSRQKLNGQGRM